MWYNVIPDLNAAIWLSQTLGLFGNTLDAVMSLPVLRFFLVFLLFLAVMTFFSVLIRRGRKNKM